MTHGNKQTTEDFIRKAKIIHGNKYTYDKSIYNGSKYKIIITCLLHGDFKISPDHFLNNKYGCQQCLFEKTGRIYKLNQKDFLKKANEIHGNEYDYSESTYLNSRTKVKIKCKKHGFFYQLANDHLQGSGCTKCKTKRISLLESLWLDSINIPRNIKNRQIKIKLPHITYVVDGFIPETNTVYEFNGDYYHGNPLFYDPSKLNKLSKLTYGFLYQRTVQKHIDLEKFGYKVISIWESEFIKQKFGKLIRNYNYKKMKSEFIA